MPSLAEQFRSDGHLQLLTSGKWGQIVNKHDALIICIKILLVSYNKGENISSIRIHM